MAFTVQEFVTSRRVRLAKDTESATLEYVGYGTADDREARLGFDAAIPQTFTPFTNPLVRLDFDSQTLGGLFWRAVAEFGPDPAPLFPAVGGVGPPAPVAAAPGPNTPLGPDFAFDFTGVTEHVTQSKQTVKEIARNAFDLPVPAPDTEGAIGVSRDGIAGTDRVSPNLEWTRTVTFASVTTEYVRLVAKLVGTVNDGPFYGRQAGECLFMGGTCQTDDTFRAKVTFKFLDRPNVAESIPIAPGLLLIGGKRGHDYLWVSYRDKPNSGKFTKVPDAAYVERIYDYVDFAQLRIGT